MRNLSFSLPLAFCVTIASTTVNPNNVVSALVPDSRRAFLNRAASATTGATMGWVLQQQQQQLSLNHPGGCACGQCGVQQHSASCNCGNCNTQHVSGCQCGSCVASSHDAGCNCGICSSPHDAGCGCGSCSNSNSFVASAFRPPSANAYEARTVGGANPSAETAAYNVQSAKTYDRLEKSGFSLDSRADEKTRLSDALSSYSYDASPSGGTNNNSKNKNASKNKK